MAATVFINVSHMVRLERMAAFAELHGFCVRINADNRDISVLIPYSKCPKYPFGGADWHHAKNWGQLRDILGY